MNRYNQILNEITTENNCPKTCPRCKEIALYQLFNKTNLNITDNRNNR